MHIPDGYLSPQTAIPAIAIMVPFWKVASNKTKKRLEQKQLPTLALCSAFSFVIMMFNIPLGGSSVHAVGGVLAAILLGPWEACIAISVALVIQAFVFGDGGVLAIGVNCINMALIMPFSGYYIYKLIAGDSKPASRRSNIGIFAGSYAGINLAALFTAVEFGIQPLLFKAADGSPLYGYYPLSVSIPAMMTEHLLIAGIAEGIITVGAINYIAKYALHLFGDKVASKNYKPVFLGLVALIILTPIGLLSTGTAWGEWGLDELKEKIGYIPSGFEKLSDIWNAWLPDYTVSGFEGSFLSSSIGYIISAIVGILFIALSTFIIFKLVMRENNGGA